MNRFRLKPKCGTKAGYDFHVRQAKEEPCQPCIQALRIYWREQRVIRNNRINKLRRSWGTNNPEIRKTRGKMQARRAGKGDWTVEQALVLYGFDCHICKNPIDLNAPTKVGANGWEMSLHLDHVVPLSRNGKDTLENVRPAHARCNIRKWATIEEKN